MRKNDLIDVKFYILCQGFISCIDRPSSVVLKKDKNVHRFALSAIRGELLEREREREKGEKRERERERDSFGILYCKDMGCHCST